MGKRELLIIAAFVAVGVIVYQFTAPPSTSTSSFSFANIFNEARREMRGNPGRASVTHTATLALAPGQSEIRVLRVGRDVQVIGEARTDVEYSLTVSSNGPDEATAKTYAERTVFQRDDVAESLILRVDYPDEASQEATAIIKVPARLMVRVENSVGVTISGVAGAHVEAARGAVNLTNIAGPVTGMHSDGDVNITGAESVKMRLTRLRSNLSGVSGGLTLDVRDGECQVKESNGPLEVDSLRAELTLTGHRGQTIVRGTDGRVTLDGPLAESRVDMRRAEVEVTTAGRAPITILTTDQTARLIVSDGAAFALDAMTTGGQIQSGDLGLTPEKTGDDSKLVHTFGGGKGTRVTIRNSRGDIVVRK